MTDTKLAQAAPFREAIVTKHLIRSGILAAIIASVADLLVYTLVPALFNFTLEFPVQGPGSEVQQLPVFMVLTATVFAAIGATILLALLNRFTSRPRTFFRIVAVVVLLLSFGAPFSLAAPLSVRLTLATMHIIAAILITYTLTRQA